MGTGWIFGGWPPPPPSDGAFVTFDAVKAALALADTPVGFNNQRITALGAPAGDTDAVNRIWDFEGSFRTFAPRVPPLLNGGPPATVNAGANLDIPGPAAGFIRIINNVLATVTGAATTVQTTLLSPALPGPGFAQVIQRGLAVNNTLTVACSTSTQPYALGVGETFRLTNSGANPCTVYYDYYEIPDTNVTLIRAILSTVPAILIPAAPAGFYRRPKVVAKVSGGVANSAYVYNALMIWAQDDTGSLTLQTFYNGLQIGQAAGVASPSLGVTSSSAYTVTTANLTAALAVNAATRPPMIWGAYETLPV